MLNEISCWYFDWATVGTWVGGVGSATAAVVALWLAKRDQKRRESYAKFLFGRDLVRLRGLEQVLKKASNALEDLGIFGGAEMPYDEDDLLRIEEHQAAGFRALSGIRLELEYFGRSERLFEYNPGTKDFSDLETVVNGVLKLLDQVDAYMGRAKFMEASNSIFVYTAKLSKALSPYADEISPS